MGEPHHVILGQAQRDPRTQKRLAARDALCVGFSVKPEEDSEEC